MVHVFVFVESYDENRKAIEAIEGEIVYLIRHKTNKWPEYQNEIHFSNVPGAVGVAEDIISYLTLK